MANLSRLDGGHWNRVMSAQRRQDASPLFAGGEPERVVEALGVSLSDLYDERQGANGAIPKPKILSSHRDMAVTNEYGLPIRPLGGSNSQHP
jgi:hypothetical protein